MEIIIYWNSKNDHQQGSKPSQVLHQNICLEQLKLTTTLEIITPYALKIERDRKHQET
jgi:hypothetical protein